MSYRLLIGDAIEQMRSLPDQSIHCCVTSPPYFGLRDYGVEGQIGLEDTPDAFIARLVEVFREVRRVLRDDGTCWVNLGDSYVMNPSTSKMPRSAQGNGTGAFRLADDGDLAERRMSQRANAATAIIRSGLKKKDRMMIPARFALAAQADGWWLRDEIVWHKPNPMPSSVKDRTTPAHEMIYLLTKRARYWFDAEAWREPAVARSAGEMDGGPQREASGRNANEGRNFRKQDEVGKRGYSGFNERYFSQPAPFTRNRRSVWTVTTKPYSGAHFATFPPDLIEPCILAGCPRGGTVLDPFGGSGTTAGVALRSDRNAVLIDINEQSRDLVPDRIAKIAGGRFAREAAE